MTEYMKEFKRPKRRNHHHAMVELDRGLKESYRNGTLVRPKKTRKRKTKASEERE